MDEMMREAMRKAELSRTVGTEPSPELGDSPAVSTTRVEPKKPLDQRDASHLARMKLAMVAVLVENRDADLLSPGAVGLIAKQLHLSAKTLTNWFAGTEAPVTRRIRDALAEVTIQAANARERAARQVR